jgi:uncharacterized membrane protein YcaP (DUF421 family)
MEFSPYLLTAGRAFWIYIIMLIVIRFLGKREIGSFSAFDLLVALMLGEVADEIIYGDVPFSQGVLAIIAIALIQYLTGWLSFSSPRWEKILEGQPAVVIREGKFQRDSMRRERLSEGEIYALLRELNIENLNEVKVGRVETNGKLSVIKQTWAQSVKKSDVEKLKG